MGDGDGGKVVVCRSKAEEGEDYKYVLKIRSKVSLAALMDTERYRELLETMLNLPAHRGVKLH